MQRTDQLLLELSKELHCTYVSDLHKPEMRQKLSDAAAALLEKYPLTVWSEALSYAMGSPLSFDSAAGLREYLKSCSGKPQSK